MKPCAFVLLLAAACASSRQDLPPVSIEVAQYDAIAGAFIYNGPTSVRYEITVHNDTDQPVTLHRIRIATSGAGAYVIPPTDTPTNIQAAPHSSASASITLWGTSLGGQLYSHAPVTLRYTGYFDSGKGAFLRAGTAILQQE
jgi:hypothetical protein